MPIRRCAVFAAAVFLVFGCVGTGRAEEQAAPFTLRDVLLEALRNNPEIKAAGQETLGARARILKAWGLEDPRITFENDNARNSPFSIDTADQSRIGFTQEIPFPVKFFLRAEQASRELQKAQHAFDQTVNDVLAQVQTAYYDLALAGYSKNIVLASRQVLTGYRDVANRKYSLGSATQTDVLRAEVEMGKLLTETVGLEAKEISAKAKLSALLNRPLEIGFGTPQTPELKQEPAELKDSIDKALASTPRILAMQAEIKAAESALGLAHMDLAPDVMAHGEYRWTKDGLDMWEGMLAVSFPLWIWKQAGGIQEAKAFLQSRKDMLEAERNRIMAEIRDATARIHSAWHRVQIYRSSVVPQAEQTVNIAQASYQSDKVDFETLLGNWRDWMQYRIDEYGAMVDYEQGMADLQRVLGFALEKKS